MTSLESILGRIKEQQKVSKKPLRTMIIGDTHHINKIIREVNKVHKIEMIGYVGDGMAIVKIEKR